MGIARETLAALRETREQQEQRRQKEHEWILDSETGVIKPVPKPEPTMVSQTQPQPQPQPQPVQAPVETFD